MAGKASCGWHLLKACKGKSISCCCLGQEQLGQEIDQKEWEERSWGRSYLGNKGYEKLCHIPGILDTHAHARAGYKLRKDLKRPKVLTSD